MLYSAKVMDHFSHPRNVGEMPDATAVGEVGNAKCGDIMKIYLKIDENDIITDCSFETFGCASAIATSSMATELIKGQPLSKALELTNSAVVEALGGLPPAKIHCSVLAEEAVKAAILTTIRKQGVTHRLLRRSVQAAVPAVVLTMSTNTPYLKMIATNNTGLGTKLPHFVQNT